MELKHKKERKLNKNFERTKRATAGKSQKGITLIALVITIIVLLILAGVSIATLTGDNGILTKAQTAKEETENASDEEQRQLAMLNATMSTEKYDYTTGEKDTNGQPIKVPIPAGFTPTQIEGENKVSEGFVITDENGNEFVWVPCDQSKGGVEYKQNETEKTSGKDTTVTDNGGDDGSVEKYGGFYIGRYEAGLPKEYWKNNEDGTYEYKWDGENKENNMYGERVSNPGNYTPVSKKNYPGWTGITRDHAKEVSEKMYEGNTQVKSELVDTKAWDSTVKWLNKEGINVEDSTEYGNYLNSELNLNGLYRESEYSWENNQWVNFDKQYKKGKKHLSARETGENIPLVEIATGSFEKTKTKNIYDMAGNLWEMTMGIRAGNDSGGTTVACRGGCYTNFGNVFDVGVVGSSAAQNGNLVARDCWSIGFRVVLYLI